MIQVFSIEVGAQDSETGIFPFLNVSFQFYSTDQLTTIIVLPKQLLECLKAYLPFNKSLKMLTTISNDKTSNVSGTSIEKSSNMRSRATLQCYHLWKKRTPSIKKVIESIHNSLGCVLRIHKYWIESQRQMKKKLDIVSTTLYWICNIDKLLLYFDNIILSWSAQRRWVEMNWLILEKI